MTDKALLSLVEGVFRQIFAPRLAHYSPHQVGGRNIFLALGYYLEAEFPTPADQWDRVATLAAEGNVFEMVFEFHTDPSGIDWLTTLQRKSVNRAVAALQTTHPTAADISEVAVRVIGSHAHMARHPLNEPSLRSA